MTQRRSATAALGVSAALLATIALAACSSGTGRGPSGTPAASPGPSLFTGRSVCREAPAPSGGADVLYVQCDTTASDPRIVGTQPATAAAHDSVTEGSVGTFWSEFTIPNEGGVWRCKNLVMGSSETGMGWEDDVCVGEGGYAGLTAYMHQISHDMWTWSFIGWVDETE